MAFRQRLGDDGEEVDPISVGPHLLGRKYRSVELFGGHPSMPSHGGTLLELWQVLADVEGELRDLAEQMVDEILEATRSIDLELVLFEGCRRAPGAAFLSSGFDGAGTFLVTLSADEEVATLLAAGEDVVGRGTAVVLMEVSQASWLQQPGDPDGPGVSGEPLRPLLAQAILTAHAEIRKRVGDSCLLQVVTEPVLVTDPEGEVWFGTDAPAALAARREEQLVHERAAAAARPADPEASRPSGR